MASETSPDNGLSDAEVQARRDRGDANRFADPKSRSALAIIRVNVFTRFNALLGTLFVLMLVLGPWQDALFGGVLAINALIGIAQEMRAKRALERLAVLTQTRAQVVRSGRAVEIAAADIVLDDVLLLAAGDQVPVDATVLSAEELELDESLLTGEADPVPKQVGDIAWSGSLVVAGAARCRVTQVGASAHVQQLTREARRFRLARSEIRSGINRILRYVTWAIVPTALLLILSQIGLRISFADALRFSTGGVVAMVPEGLVLLTSAALALGAIRLARHRTFVQDLPAIETLARIDTLCLDKTGTLTEREPTLHRVEWLCDQEVGAKALAALAAVEPHPNATLQAIARTYGGAQTRAEQAVPFSSQRKWAAARLGELGTWLIGAPEVLLSTSDSKAVTTRASDLARAGYRVLLLGRTNAAIAAAEEPEAVTPVALVVLAERIRADAPATLRYFEEQGITIKIISGDHAATVGQIAHQLGIAMDESGVDLRAGTIESDRLPQLASSHSVFGRVTPEQKRAIIAALQAEGHVVAMIGDGANDILGLKQADVGIAMGAGTSAARAISQLVLVDNAFARLPTVVGEGRRVIGNVERVAALFLTKTTYAMLLAFTVGLAHVTFPFLPRHLTLIGALTIGVPAFFLSLEPNAARVRTGFVERVLRFSVPAGLVAAIATFATYSLLAAAFGAGTNEARTGAAIALFAVTAWIVALVARPLTAQRAALVAALCTAFVVILRVPSLRKFFALERLDWSMWAGTAAVVIATGAIAAWSSSVSRLAARPLAAVSADSVHAAFAWLRTRPRWLVLAAAVLVVAGAWLSLGILEDVISHNPLVEVDALAHNALQAMRTQDVDDVMVAISELGDAEVLLPVIIVALAWFIVHRYWRTAIYWFVAMGAAEVLINAIGLALRRPRPVTSTIADSFSFPSSHATLSVVVYGLLALLLAQRASHFSRLAMLSGAGLLIGAISFSRLYLGVHWLSDVLAGLIFATAWVTALALALAYLYPRREMRRTGGFAAAVLATVVIAAAVHMTAHHAIDLLRYAPMPGDTR